MSFLSVFSLKNFRTKVLIPSKNHVIGCYRRLVIVRNSPFPIISFDGKVGCQCVGREGERGISETTLDLLVW